jgi:GTP cyclohydrolase II
VNGFHIDSEAGEAWVDRKIPAEFVAETNLPTDVGQFRLRAYRSQQSETNEYVGREPSVIYAAGNPPFGTDGRLRQDVPIRIHDQCITSEVFGSQRCVIPPTSSRSSLLFVRLFPVLFLETE